jgi:hypothetical protein
MSRSRQIAWSIAAARVAVGVAMLATPRAVAKTFIGAGGGFIAARNLAQSD